MAEIQIGSLVTYWDIGTDIRRVVGGAGRHDTTYLVLLQPAFSEYDPTQMGDREDDI